ncbi:MAG: efflux transporter outer membrane subunit, partial [Sphingomonadales bacterium]
MPLSRIVFLTGTLVLAGCTMSPDYERPEVVTPPDWSVAAGEDGGAVNASDPAWWSHFGSAELDRLIARAFDANTDLAASIHRVAQARASVRVAGAALLPAVDAGGSLSRDWNEPFSNASDGVSGWSSQVGVSYELDFWGRNRAAIDAASAQLDATVYDHETLRLVVAADVGLTYAEALTINDQLRLTREQRDNARGILELVEARFEAGAVSGLELAQQRTELANFDARIAALVRQREAAANRLAVLIGEAPQSFARPTGTLASLAVPDMAADPPAVLLTRRPDLRRAEAELVAAHADIGAARAAFFPSFRLGADLAAGARPISAATDTVAGIAASVVAPIFSGGRLEGNVER